MAAPSTFDPSQHATVLSDAGNNKRWSCNYCPHEFSGLSSRVLTHLAGIEEEVVELSSDEDA